MVSNRWVVDDCEITDSGFQVKLHFSPVPGMEERLKRAFSLILRASIQASESDLSDRSEPQDSVDFDCANC